MRLGGNCYRPETLDELEAIVAKLDEHGLSAIPAPRTINAMADEEVVAFGERAHALGIAINDAVPGLNLLVRDQGLRATRLEQLRTMLRKSELMGCRGVIVLVGSVAADDHLASVDPYMFTRECRAEFRDLLLRALDSLELSRTAILVEPWTNSFFYQPEDIAEFLSTVADPRVRLHMDPVNMVSQANYFATGELIDRAFDLLAGQIGGVHFKDVRWDWRHMLLKLDEVLVGDGVLDYDTLLRRLSELEDQDLTCFCEHLTEEAEYVENFRRVRERADRAGIRFAPRLTGGAE
jgi:sugar phosphate isomerase/epimerase